jgi:hypothetical protein
MILFLGKKNSHYNSFHENFLQKRSKKDEFRDVTLDMNLKNCVVLRKKKILKGKLYTLEIFTVS